MKQIYEQRRLAAFLSFCLELGKELENKIVQNFFTFIKE